MHYIVKNNFPVAMIFTALNSDETKWFCPGNIYGHP